MSPGALLLWILAPLAGIHLLMRKNGDLLRFQLLLDLLLAAVCWPLLLGLDLNPVRLLEHTAPFEGWHWSKQTALEPTASDVVRQLHPWWDLERRRLPAGEVPWLAPEIGAGTPLVGSGQSGWLAPVMAPVWVLGPEAGTDVMAVWKLEAAGVGAFLLLAGCLELSFPAAAVGGLAWGGAPFLVGWLLWPVGWNLAALPWLWRHAVRLTEKPGKRAWGAVVGAGVLWGWFLGCGLNPETAVIVLGSALLAALVLHPGRWGRLAGAMAVAVPFGLLLAWPALSVIAASSKLRVLTETHPNRTPLPLSLDLAALRQLLNPAALGHPWAGSWSGPYPYPAGAAGVGGAALMLAALGRVRRRYRRWAAAAALTGLVGLVVAMRPPGVSALLGRVPLLSTMTLPRFVLLVPWALAVLAALGCDGVVRGRRRWAAAGLPLLMLAVAGGWRGGWGPGSWALALAPVAAAAAVLVLGVRRPSVAALPVAVELAVLAMGINPAAAAADRLPRPPILQRLQRAVGPGERVVGLDGVLPANLACRYGLADLRAFGPVRPWPLARLHDLLGAPDPVLGGALHRAPPRLLGAWSVRWAVAPEGRRLAGWTEFDRGDGVRVWKNRWWRPEVRLVGRAVVAQSEEAGWRLLAEEPGLLPDGVVLPPGTPEPHAATVKLDLVEDRPEKLMVRTVGDGPTVLAVARCWAPGWAASVDGGRVPVVRVNMAGLGVVVPEGRHEVRLAYRPYAVRVAR